MSLPTINLDDRRFDDLLESAYRQIRQSCPGWTDLTMGDPGVVLLEVFVHVTESMLYRLNRVPEKVKIELLNLIGVNLHPPAAAGTELVFSVRQPLAQKTEISRGTRVAADRAGGAEPPVFATANSVAIEAGASETRVWAYHADFVEGELIGHGSGSPGLAVSVQRPPIVSASGGGPELVVAVEVPEGSLPAGTRGVQFQGKSYQVWREVEDFADLGEDRNVYSVDRHQGQVQFAPALRARPDGAANAGEPIDDAPRALAEIPSVGAEIRAWYWRGGGVQGNVAANTLTVMKDGVPGITVNNPKPASGGRAAESFENAVLRGPQEIHSLKRAVTARDFELCALRTGAADRAHAYTKAELWHHAPPGTVEVLLLPHIPAAERSNGPVTAELVREHCERNAALIPRIRQELDLRRPLGTNCLVNWVHCKPVRVAAQVVAFHEEDPGAVERRILEGLYRHINPLPSPPDYPGWTNGQPLTSWHVYRIISAEPGVKSIKRMRLVDDEVPGEDIKALDADRYQAKTWYAGSRDTLYRSMNEGESWEPVQKFVDETIVAVKPFDQPAAYDRSFTGSVAVVTSYGDTRSRIHLSLNCGETWQVLQPTAFPVADAAWLEREGRLSLLLAADRGLFELAVAADADPNPMLVDPKNPRLGFYRVAVLADGRNPPAIAVSARDERGVFLSTSAGERGSFHAIGLENQLVRVLAVQESGASRYLWAGVAAPGTAPGKGCYRWRLTRSATTPGGWEDFSASWAAHKAGSCLSLAFQDGMVFAATRNRGVLRLAFEERESRWEAPDVNCGLPLREIGRLQPVESVAASPRGTQLLAGGRAGVYRSTDRGVSYQNCSAKEFETEVPLPANWLFCSKEHAIEVLSEDASG
jgi:hypothetical protein